MVSDAPPPVTPEERDYKLSAHAISAIRSIAEAAIQAVNEQNQPHPNSEKSRFTTRDFVQ